MTFSNVNQLKLPSNDIEPGLDQGLIGGPSQADVDLFNAAMRPELSVHEGRMSEQIASALWDRLGAAETLSQQVVRKMKRASTSDDPMDISQVGRSLSQYSLQMALTTKVISKSVQALDKLTNLQ